MSKLNVAMVGDNVLIDPTPPEKKSPGGIVIPTVAQQKACSGTVVAFGPGRVLESGATLAPQVRVGDMVHFNEYQCSPVTLDSVKYLVIKESCLYLIDRGGGV